MNAEFIHLRVHSAYSLAEGAIKNGKLIDACAKMEMPAVAVTDTNNLFGAMDFCTNAAKKGLQPILGMQADVFLDKKTKTNLVFLVQTKQGYYNLSKLNSWMYTRKDPLDDPALKLEWLEGLSDGLICLTGGTTGPLAHYLQNNHKDEAVSFTEKLKTLFPNRLYIELNRHGNYSKRVDQDMIQLAHDCNVPLVATNNAYFLNKEFYAAHDALLCIASGRYVNETDRRRETPDHYLKKPAEMVALFADVPEAVSNTVVIAKRIGFYLQNVKTVFPPFATNEGRTEDEELIHQSEEGLKWRLEKYVLPKITDAAERERLTKEYTERLRMELPIILKMGFSGYFLIVADFIQWSKNNNIPVGPGRGSGAGSLVAWSIQITDIDPIPYGLLFERFLNPERVSLPDFDIDFCQDRRDEVIAYVQKKYGMDRVGQIITFGELKARAAVKDVGRVLQMPYGQVDRISKMIPHNPAKPISLTEAIETTPELQAERDKEETVQRLLDVALQVEGLYRHASTHAAGIVIGDRPLEDTIPLYQDPRSTIPATQYNLKYIEQAGLIKFDFLGLKTLTVLQKALEFIKANTGQDIDLLNLPMEDDKVYALFRAGHTLGIFQFESSGMQEAMRQVKPTRFEDLIALNALYRPGPMENIPQYGKVKNGHADAEYPHPTIKPILEETYGIMVYQEQVMEIGRVMAGYTLGGADMLRRAMGKKIKAEMDAQRDRFVDGAKATNNISTEKATEVFDLMAKFADYGFNKSHAAAYSLIAYQTAYLKVHYPAEFMAALMTLDMGDTDKVNLYAQELRILKLQLLPPDMNKSFPYFAVEDGNIRYALAALRGVGYGAMEDLVAERKKGSFKNLQDLIERMDAKSFSKRQIEILACAGAFDAFGSPRAAVFAGAEYLMRRIQRRHEEAVSGQVSLFATSLASKDLEPVKLPDVSEWPSLEKLQNEFGAVGFYLSAHPVDNYGEWLDKKGYTTYRQIAESAPPMRGGKIAGVVVKKVEKKSDRGRFAFVTISGRTGVFDVTVYTEPLTQYRDLFVAGNILSMQVDVQWREEEPRLILSSAAPLDQIISRSINNVQINLTKSADPEKLAKFLAKCGQGNIKISVNLPLTDTNAIVTLQPDHGIKLMESDIQEIKKFSGVEVVVQ